MGRTGEKVGGACEGEWVGGRVGGMGLKVLEGWGREITTHPQGLLDM